MAKGKNLNATKIEDIKSVYSYLDRDKKKMRGPKRKTEFQLRQNTAAALKLSTSMVYKVIQGQCDLAGKSDKRHRRSNLDDYQKQLIRQVYSYCTTLITFSMLQLCEYIFLYLTQYAMWKIYTIGNSVCQKLPICQ